MFIVVIVLSRNEYRAVTARIITVESLRDGSFASSFVSLKHLSHRRCGTQDNNNTSVIIIRKRPDRRRYDRQVPSRYPSPSSATTVGFLSRQLTVTVWTSLLVCLSVTNEPPHGFCDDRGAVDGGTDRRCRISGGWDGWFQHGADVPRRRVPSPVSDACPSVPFRSVVRFQATGIASADLARHPRLPIPPPRLSDLPFDLVRSVVVLITDFGL